MLALVDKAYPWPVLTRPPVAGFEATADSTDSMPRIRPTIKLDPTNVPEPLRILIPLAEKFGVSDDIMRDDLYAKTPKEELEMLKRTFAKYDDQLDKWLAGPEAKGLKYSREYIAGGVHHRALLPEARLLLASDE